MFGTDLSQEIVCKHVVGTWTTRAEQSKREHAISGSLLPPQHPFLLRIQKIMSDDVTELVDGATATSCFGPTGVL